MWVISVSLLSLWVVLLLFGVTLLGFTHLLGVGGLAIELLHRPGPRRPVAATH